MTVAALWTKHRPIAYAIASEYRIPGQDRDDTAQDALVALWEACGAYDKGKGPFPPFARLVVHRRLTDRLRAETRQVSTVELKDAPAVDTAPSRERLHEMVDRLSTLTDMEFAAVRSVVNGRPMSARESRAANRARHKLRAA